MESINNDKFLGLSSELWIKLKTTTLDRNLDLQEKINEKKMAIKT